jgi:hypothetical protein
VTLKITVDVPQDQIEAGNAALYLAKAMTAIGYSRYVQSDNAVLADEGPNCVAMKAAADKAEPAPVEENAPEEPTNSIRYLGQASDGRKRRTKEELALDEEAQTLLEKVGLTEAKFNAALDKAHGDWNAVMADLRAAAQTETDEPKANVSTGEERVDPENPTENDADENEEPLTHDDVRNALGDYAAKFGMPAAQKNGPKLMGADKISAIPDDQVALRAAVDAIRAEIAGA